MKFLTFSGGRGGYLGSGLSKYSTAAAIEEPIKPSVAVEHTQLLIDGKFVDAASGLFSFSLCLSPSHFHHLDINLAF